VTAVAAGWLEGEFATLQAPYERRGKLLDEWLRLAASVFEQMPGHVRHEGQLALDGWMAPPLVRPGGPELWVAGVSPATLRRAAVTGVWHPVALTPDELRPMAAELRERRADSRVILRIGAYITPKPQSALDERGRHAIAGPPEWVAERLREYMELGCNGFVLNLGHASADLEERIPRFAQEIAPLLRD
jgi:alkanesulfonate monooxygenase SsuD/methylene tetrahydromethanopterin reductase-like flavin-dependent oxidoreductase (luciferase family)